MRDIDAVATTDPEVISHHDASRRTQEERVCAHESQERGGFRLDLPGVDGEADERADELSTADVDVFGEQSGKIIREGDGVAGDVGHDVEEHEQEASEELACAVFEVVDGDERVPLDFAVDD